jgi:argininosuccinate lyase
LQITKEIFLPAFGELSDCIGITRLMLESLTVNEHIFTDEKYDLIFSVEKVNELVLNGIPFREAYKKIGQEIEDGKFIAEKTLNHTHEGSIGNLCNDEIAAMKNRIVAEFNFEKAINAEKNLLNTAK